MTDRTPSVREALAELLHDAAVLSEVYDAMGAPRGPARIKIEASADGARAALAAPQVQLEAPPVAWLDPLEFEETKNDPMRPAFTVRHVEGPRYCVPLYAAQSATSQAQAIAPVQAVPLTDA